MIEYPYRVETNFVSGAAVAAATVTSPKTIATKAAADRPRRDSTTRLP
jgi:hypothetical protein